MSQPSVSEPRDWLVIDTSQAGVMRFAAVRPSDRPRIDTVVTIPTHDVPTFTDALQRYERQTGHQLRGTQCVLAMAGPVSGEMLTMVRSRWTISRGGLQPMFGQPVTIVNDVAARAWGLRAATPTVETIRGAGAPSINRPGRYLMLLVDEGVGACTVDIDRTGTIRVLESEAGHTDFAPASEREEMLARTLRGASPFVSIERLLTTDSSDPAWNGVTPVLPDAERQRLLAGVLGRFVINLVHFTGAWQGVIISGNRAQKLLSGMNRSAFEGAFGQRRDFTRLLISTPVWRVEQREAVLTGAAELLAAGRQPDVGLRSVA